MREELESYLDDVLYHQDEDVMVPMPEYISSFDFKELVRIYLERTRPVVGSDHPLAPGIIETDVPDDALLEPGQEYILRSNLCPVCHEPFEVYYKCDDGTIACEACYNTGAKR